MRVVVWGEGAEVSSYSGSWTCFCLSGSQCRGGPWVGQGRIRSINLVSCLLRLPLSFRLVSLAFRAFLSFPLPFYDFFGHSFDFPFPFSPFLCHRLSPSPPSPPHPPITHTSLPVRTTPLALPGPTPLPTFTLEPSQASTFSASTHPRTPNITHHNALNNLTPISPNSSPCSWLCRRVREDSARHAWFVPLTYTRGLLVDVFRTRKKI